MSSTSPTGLDALLQKIMDPHIQSKHLNKPKDLSGSKRPRNKRKDKQSKSSEKPTYKSPKMDDDIEKRRLDKNESSKHKYHYQTQALKNLKETMQD